MSSYSETVDALLQTGEVRRLYHLVSREVSRGNADAFNTMGYLFDNGLHVRQDYEEAVLWYMKAADLGCVRAVHNLGASYVEGKGIRANRTKGLKLLREAADRGIVYSWFYLGRLHAEGVHVRQDLKKARRCLETGCDKGCAYSRYYLGSLLVDRSDPNADRERGFALLADAANNGISEACTCLYLVLREQGAAQWEEALTWLHKGVELGGCDACYEMGLLYHKERHISESRHLADHHFRLAAKQGHPEAQYLWGSMLLSDKFRPVKERRKGRDLIVSAANNGSGRAQLEVGRFYFRGSCFAQDYVAARKWFEKAAAQGESEAVVYLGEIHNKGLGFRVDRALAAQWYHRAAEMNESWACYRLSYMYCCGEGVERDVVTGAEWARKAAEAGLPAGQYLYAWYLDNGEGVDEDAVAARAWLESAAAQGDADAVRQLEVKRSYETDEENLPISYSVN